MKSIPFKSTHNNKYPIAGLLKLVFMLFILSLSMGVTHGFAKDKEISGYVGTSSGNEIGGVTIAFSNGEGSTTTDSSGYYSQKVKEGWSGTATPSTPGYNFDPANRNYSKVKKDQTNQDYIGTQDQSEPSSNLEHDGDDGYGCFVGCLH